MKNNKLAALLFAGAFSALGAGCGSDDSGLECGADTVEVDGTCVPTGSVCADGTVFDNGECVPDGSVICETGTTYDDATGTCVPDITGCAEGTVLVDGQCIPEDDALTADITEPPEPNGLNAGDAPGQFTVPAEGDSVTIGGCIEPFEDVAPADGEIDTDFDAYAFSVTGPTLLDVTVDGLDGLAGAFVMLTADEELANAGWQRFGVNLVGDTSSRQVFLPKAGVYVLAVADSRSLFLSASGGPNACYFATVSTLPLPEPTAYTGAVEGTLGDAAFFSVDPVEGGLMFATVEAPSQSAAAALTVLVNGEYRSSSPLGAEGDPANANAFGFADDDEVLLVVESALNYSLTDVAYTLDAALPPVQLAPADGSSVTLTNDGLNFLWLYFDAEAGDVVTLDYDVSNSAGGTSILVGAASDGLIKARPCPAGCTSYNGTLQLADAGRYYLIIFDESTTPEETIDVTLTRTHDQPTPVVIGTPITATELSDDGVDWYELDVSTSDWATYTGTPSDFAGEMDVTLYDRTGVGELNVEVPVEDNFVLGAGEVGRVYEGNYKTFLVRVADTGAAVDATYDLDIAERDFIDQPVDALNPVNTAGVTLEAGETHLYLVRAAPFADVTFTVKGAAGTDLKLDRLNPQEIAVETSNNSGDAGEEAITTKVGLTGVLAFAVADAAGEAGTYDVRITSVDPPYILSTEPLPFTSVCPSNGGSGSVHAMADDGSGFGAGDEGLSAAPVTLDFGFSLFGDEVTELTVSTNGWLTFETGYAGDAAFANQLLPDPTAPNGVIAPFWADIVNAQVCVATAADRITVEWSGQLLSFFGDGPPVQFQLVLHDDGSFDAIYGPGHAASSSVATIGLENLAADVGFLVSFETEGAGVAGTSYTFTPTPAP